MPLNTSHTHWTSNQRKLGKMSSPWAQASMVKWTALDPCSCLCESDPKLYTNFEFYEIEIHKHLENIWIYKAKQFLFTKKQFQTTYIYFRRLCKWWTSGWRWKDNCHDMKLMNLQSKNYYDLKFIMNSRNMDKIFKFKIFKVMKLTFKIIFSKLLLHITFEDRFWRSQIDILYLST